MFLEAFPVTTGESIGNTMVNLSRPSQTRKKVHRAKEGSTLRGMILAHGDSYGPENEMAHQGSQGTEQRTGSPTVPPPAVVLSTGEITVASCLSHARAASTHIISHFFAEFC